MSTITTNAFQNNFIFNKEYIKHGEFVFSEDFLAKSYWQQSLHQGIAAWEWDSIESYHVDKTLAKNLCLEKVIACFDRIKEMHSKGEKFDGRGFGNKTEDDYPIESGFCKRIFRRLHMEKGEELPNPYPEEIDKHRVWDFYTKEMRIVREPPHMDEYRDESRKWFMKREVLALNEIDEKLERYANDPSQALTAIATLEKKEREIQEKIRKVKRERETQEKIRKVKRVALCILFLGLFSLTIPKIYSCISACFRPYTLPNA